jgi:beta-fructofuranosidase
MKRRLFLSSMTAMLATAAIRPLRLACAPHNNSKTQPKKDSDPMTLARGMNYAPKNLFMWDTWYMPIGDVVHAYHLQRLRPGATIPPENQDMIGHAVSRNLIDWEECPPVLGPDPSNPIDDLYAYTGCALWHEGQGHLYYTMRNRTDGGRIQRMGLALSPDGYEWTRYPGNPVIVPDPKWYATVGDPIPGVLDCRDLVVARDPAGAGWYGFYATRKPAAVQPRTAVIACVYSKDLIHWEHRAPAFAPDKYCTIEVPDVFQLNGRWFMTCLTGNTYGNRGIFSDPNVTHGTIFAVADRPEGPYRELDDNVFLGARTGVPLSCRSVAFEGERYSLYTDWERDGLVDHGGYCLVGSLSTPKRLASDGDRLYAAYSDRIERYVIQEIIAPDRKLPILDDGQIYLHNWEFDMPSATWNVGETVTGQADAGWQILPFDAAADSFIFEATVRLETAVAAGLALRIENPHAGAIVGLDQAAQSVFYGQAQDFEFMESRQTPVKRDVPTRLKVVQRLEHVEIYVNDELRLAFCRYRGLGGRFGLFVDRGRAELSDIRLRQLQVKRPV